LPTIQGELRKLAAVANKDKYYIGRTQKNNKNYLNGISPVVERQRKKFCDGKLLHSREAIEKKSWAVSIGVLVICWQDEN